MCGLVGIISDNPIREDLINNLTKLRYRGYDSWGVCTSKDSEIHLLKDIGLVPENGFDSVIGSIGIGHVRWATHGKVTKENAHPHLDCGNEIAIVHNGIIENYIDLKFELPKHNFKSDTDSEVIAHLIEHYMHGKDFKDAFKLAIKKLVGSYAIVAMHKDYPYLMVARKDSPLLIGVTKDSVYIASDIMALGDASKIKEVEDNSVLCISREWNDGLDNRFGFVSNNKNGYEHYMLKEIYEQPKTIIDALNQDKNKLVGISFDILRARNVILTACGTSRHAAIVGRYLFSKFAKKFSELVVASELHYFADSFSDSTLVVAVSQSGETADVLSSIKLAKQGGCKVLSIINKPFSSLERLSDTTLFMNCGSEISVASTKAFTNELIVFYLLAFTMANTYDEGIKELTTLPKDVEACLKQSAKIKELAELIKGVQHIYYVGKGINFAISGECALKLKEISYIHAESMSAGELKHGTLSLVEKGTPIIGLCPNDYTYQETILNLQEAKSRGGLIIGISDKYSEVFDHWLPIPQVRDIYYPVVSTVIGQLLAYYVALGKGLNVDLPRNLAKSVTVL